MKRFKDHWGISKYGNSKFKDKNLSPLIDLLETEEAGSGLSLISFCIFCVLFYVYDYTLLESFLITTIVHTIITFILAVISTYLSRVRQKRRSSYKAFLVTLDRFEITKKGK